MKDNWILTTVRLSQAEDQSVILESQTTGIPIKDVILYRLARGVMAYRQGQLLTPQLGK